MEPCAVSQETTVLVRNRAVRLPLQALTSECLRKREKKGEREREREREGVRGGREAAAV